MRSWLEASLVALEKGGPMSARSIVEYITDNALRPITGETPEATVGAVLYTAIQNGNPAVSLRDAGVFAHTGKASPFGGNELLGRLEEVDPRDIWKDEARNFTPWLLDNADYLGEVLGLEIELESREHPVGSFSLDLYGRDITNGCVLIVENQLDGTDHKHLGVNLVNGSHANHRLSHKGHRVNEAEARTNQNQCNHHNDKSPHTSLNLLW